MDDSKSAPLWFVDVTSHSGAIVSEHFPDYITAQTFLALIPVMQQSGRWLHIARAIIRRSGISLN